MKSDVPSKKENVIDYINNKLRKVEFEEIVYSLKDNESFVNSQYYQSLNEATLDQRKLIDNMYLDIIDETYKYLESFFEKDNIFKLKKEDNQYILLANYSYITKELIKLAKQSNLENILIEKWENALPQIEETQNLISIEADIWDIYYELLPKFKEEVNQYFNSKLLINMTLQILNVKLKSQMTNQPTLNLTSQ